MQHNQNDGSKNVNTSTTIRRDSLKKAPLKRVIDGKSTKSQGISISKANGVPVINQIQLNNAALSTLQQYQTVASSQATHKLAPDVQLQNHKAG